MASSAPSSTSSPSDRVNPVSRVAKGSGGLLPAGAAAKLAKAYIENDVPSIDVGGFVVGDQQQTAVLLGKSVGVLAGVPFFTAVFQHVGCKVEWLLKEGTIVRPVEPVAIVTGPASRILLGERTALNILTRSSGIATAAKEVADVAAKAGWHGEVAGTRKTTPGFRLIEKYALLVGGASMHRMDLSSMVMLKDNHIWSQGSITDTVKAARRVCGFSSKIEVECRSLDEALEACKAGADICMLDNYTPQELKEDARRLKGHYPHVVVEASGGITKETLPAYMSPHVDVVSMGALTQGYAALDFSLKILRSGQTPASLAASYKRSKL